jgi:hypothetical protein
VGVCPCRAILPSSMQRLYPEAAKACASRFHWNPRVHWELPRAIHANTCVHCYIGPEILHVLGFRSQVGGTYVADRIEAQGGMASMERHIEADTT